MGTRSNTARVTMLKKPPTKTLRSKDFLSILDLNHAELVAVLFDKPSLRTRATFVIAIRELGGEVIEPPADVSLGSRETVEDVARNLERWVHGAVVRTFAQSRLVQFAAAAPKLRVVN